MNFNITYLLAAIVVLLMAIVFLLMSLPGPKKPSRKSKN